MKKVFLILFFPLSLFGWWDLGHMAVAKIAYERLEPSVKEEVDRLLLSSEFPESSTFVTAACWADDVGNESTLFKSIHGSSIPYDPEGILSSTEMEVECAKAETRSIVPSLLACQQTLSNPNAPTMLRALSLRLLIHLMGDLHQPLHCLALYNSDFPKGDRGGNLFAIRCSYCSNLHAFWDSMCGLGIARLHRPLDNQGEQEVAHLAALCCRFPCEATCLEGNFETWLAQTRACGVLAYEGVPAAGIKKPRPGEAPSDEYMAMGQQICMQQVALGGYRLSHLLNECLAQ